MSRPLRSRVLAAAATVPAITGAALTVPAAAASPRTFLVIWGDDNSTILGPWAGMGAATRPLPVPLPIAAGPARSGQTGCYSGYALTTAGRSSPGAATRPASWAPAPAARTRSPPRYR